MINIFELGLQFFADAGTSVNATTTITNAYTGATTARGTTNASSTKMSDELKDFYDTELLENSRVELYYAQFGKKQNLPRGHKGTVEWRKFNKFANAGVLQEAVIPSGQDFGQTNITGSVEDYGTYTTISDKLELRAFDDIILEATKEMGASAAQTQETLTRDALLAGTNVLYCDNIDANGAKKGATPTVPGDMGCSSTNGWAKLTSKMLSKAAAIMKKNRVPKINGKYYCVVHPSVVHDLRNDAGWLEAHKYAAPEELFNGEIGELHGIRFIEDEFAPVLNASGYRNKEYASGTNNGCTYACYLFGKDAFGIIEQDGATLEMIVHDKDEIGGPLNQFSTCGYKLSTNGATILYQERMLRIMCVSEEFSATDVAN